METARKHNEAVVDLAQELLTMLEEDIGATILDYQRQIRELKVEKEKAVEFAAKNDQSLELEEVNKAYHNLGKKYDDLLVKYNDLVKSLPEDGKKRRGRPKKDEVRALAEELAREGTA